KFVEPSDLKVNPPYERRSCFRLLSYDCCVLKCRCNGLSRGLTLLRNCGEDIGEDLNATLARLAADTVQIARHFMHERGRKLPVSITYDEGFKFPAQVLAHTLKILEVSIQQFSPVRFTQVT